MPKTLLIYVSYNETFKSVRFLTLPLFNKKSTLSNSSNAPLNSIFRHPIIILSFSTVEMK
ncbi:hypothetical protein [Methanobrevibacter cuticularis]|uniref:hypothetical protein n=1 Tax=Methanobrevibacter cuticularis TaxID=47311 RepID=UPI001470B90C|nr:hypothetical protein [Methanobrevibacter cuticularis]